MTGSPETVDSAANEVPETVESLDEMISECQQYRDRLFNDTVAVAKKAKMPKSTVMAQLEPELAKIDAMIEGLKQRKANLAAEA